MKKKVLVTGSAGFIFSNFIRWALRYHKEDYEFVSIDKIVLQESMHNIYANKGHKLHIGDVCDRHFVDIVFQLEQPDFVIHGAAESVSEDTIIPYMGPKKIEHLEIKDLWKRFAKRNEIKRIGKLDSIFSTIKSATTVEVIDLDSEQQRALTIKNGFGQWRQIKQISRHWYDGPIIHMVQKWGEVKVTPNHCIYNSNMELVRPSDDVELLSIRNIEPSHSLKDGVEKFGDINWKLSIDELLFMTAFYITEGWASFNKANGGYIVGFCQNDLNDVIRISEILNANFGVNCYVNKTKKCKSVTISNKRLFETFIKFCGKNSGQKRIPDFIFNLSIGLKKKFIEYLIYFDGHKYTETSKKYTTNSRVLAAQLSTLLSMVGQNYSYNRQVHKKEIWADSFNFQLSSRYNKLNKKTYKEYHYTGWVYDLEIDDTHKFVCGLGNVVVHNSHVDDSIESADRFVLSNVLGTQVIIDKCREHRVERVVYVSCYDQKTRAVTKDGFKFYEELREGDVVLSINTKTGEIEEKKIKKVIIQDYDGKMLHFNNRRVDFCVTPNHNCLYVDSPTKDDSKLNWSVASHLICNDYKRYLPTGRVNKTSIKNVWIKNIGSVDASALFYVCGVFIADGFCAYQKKEMENKTGLSRSDFLKKCRDKTGRFIKVGKIGIKDKSVCNSYRVFFDVPENDKARSRLEKSLDELNIKYHTQKNKSGEHIFFSSKEWMSFFECFGYLAKNKYIPTWMLDYNYDLLKTLWDGIHDGDGHGYGIKGRTVSITTVSDKLAGQLCYLGSCLGFTTRIGSKHSLSYIKGRRIESQANVIFFSEYRKPKIPKYTEINYSGKVWCLSVQDNKNFLVERNGLIMFSGNTDEVYGQLSENDKSWTEEFTLAPRNPYAATKAAGEFLVKAAHETHGLQYNITRACNNFGPRQSATKLIPKIIKCIIEEKPIPVYGQGAQIREWIHVADNCSAIMQILNGPANEVYNISSNYELSNLELVNMICNIMNGGHSLISFVEERAGHDFRYSVDNTKLKNLGWKPNFKFRKGLELCIKWYVNNRWFLGLKNS